MSIIELDPENIKLPKLNFFLNLGFLPKVSKVCRLSGIQYNSKIS